MVVAYLAQEAIEGPAGQPLPGGAAEIVRFFFHVPQPIQIGGAVLAVVAGLALLVLGWRERRRILLWFRARSTPILSAMAAAALLLIVAAAWAGSESWNYMQHDNDFCTGCHIMGESFRRFQHSEHSDLSCHDCHQQSITASARQLYLWVADRPEEIGPHSPVPNRVCMECHVEEDPDSVWQRIASTAGHRVHLESDSSALADVMCVTCHGVEVHEFAPVDQTCGQSDCHSTEETQIVMGAMATQSALHCVTCHEFTAPVDERTPPDSAALALIPGESRCFSCHEMREAMVGELAELEADPHQAQCGLCHDPHTQTTPGAASATCTEGGCHTEVETLSPFHRGLHSGVLEACLVCHEPHRFEVQGQRCLSCHEDVMAETAHSGKAPPPRERERDTRLASLRFDPAWLGSGAAVDTPPDPRPSARFDSIPFRHREHRDVDCVQCHSTEEGHGELRVSRLRDCRSCHHGSPIARSCERCHENRELSGDRPVPSTLHLSTGGEKTRDLPFDHGRHEEFRCGRCHAASLERSSDGAACTECHEEHHELERACRSCHVPAADAHPLEAAHLTCAGSGCHASNPVVPLRHARSLCLGCHPAMADHEPEGDCAACHAVPPLQGPTPSTGASSSVLGPEGPP